MKHASSGGHGTHTTRMPLNGFTRFHCSCGFEWITETDEAEAQGRFLDRARLR